MNIMTDPKKDCFGILDRVFPLGKEELREITPSCFQCPDRQDCLRAALDTSEGIRLRSRVLEKTPVQGIMDRVKRWSEKKTLHRLEKMKEGAGR